MYSLIEKIYNLENLLLQPETRKSQSKLNELLADEFREFGSSGRIYSKDDILKKLPTEKNTKFFLSEFEIKQLSPTTVLSTYKVRQVIGEQITFSLRSSIWQKVNNDWQMIFHQGTTC